MAERIQVAVVGATGYAGFELARLLLRHPRVATPILLRREGDDKSTLDLADVYPQVSGNGNLPLLPFSWDKLKQVDLLFLSSPHELSREWVPEALGRGLRVVDLSGAWRLKKAENRAVYGLVDRSPELAGRIDEQAVYGLCELNREAIKQAQLVANPGCYPTSIILALAPLVEAGAVDLEHGIVCDSKSGVSGAGKAATAKTHFVEVADNLSAYSVFTHRHTGEILETLKIEAEQLVFTPHLLPIPRGILSTMYLRLAHAMTAAQLQSCWREFYRGRPFVRVFGAQLPQIKFVLNTNYCDVGFCLAPDARRLVVVSCIDNLIKGAAGQAVQNMNLMYGWSEEEGLH